MEPLNRAENKINQEVIRRAIERSDVKTQEKEKLLKQQDVIDALEDVTDLPRLELEQIAREVRESYANSGDEFFSVKHQLLIIGLIGFTVVSFIAFAVWLF